MLAMSGFFSPSLADLVPTQFDPQGNTTALGKKEIVLFILPLFYFLVVSTLPFLVKLAPPKFQMKSATEILPKALSSIGLLFLSLHFGFLMNAKEPSKYAPVLWLTIGMGLFMVSIGIAIEKIERNLLVGVRTPWSLASEANWQATHRFAAKIMVVTGVLLLLMSALARPSFIIAIASLLFSVIVPVFYSLWYFQNVEKKS